jgi:hypothetical protein
MLKLPVLVDLQQKGELVIFVIFSTSIIILENTLNWCIEKSGYGNFNHRYNFPSIYLLLH